MTRLIKEFKEVFDRVSSACWYASEGRYDSLVKADLDKVKEALKELQKKQRENKE